MIAFFYVLLGVEAGPQVRTVQQGAPCGRFKGDARHDITVNGPGLAAHALKAGLVDELQMFVCPAVVGAGMRFFPDGVRLKLELIDERRFRTGVVVLRYAVRG
jgi:dihydrofolate reductase